MTNREAWGFAAPQLLTSKHLDEEIARPTPKADSAQACYQSSCYSCLFLYPRFTHSGGLHVGVEITYDPRQFRLRVRDDGRGFDPKILEDGGRPDHWGLQGMRERP